MQQPLPAIPTPAGQKFREFRVRFLPLLVFACTLGGIIYLWHGYVSPASIVAQVEPVLSDVRSRDDGILTNLFVHRFQHVRAGDVVAAVLATDTRRANADLQMLRTEIAVSQMEMSTLVDRERLAFNYQDLRTEYLRFKTDLEKAKAELPRAEFDVLLSSNLLKEKVLSEFDFRRYRSVYDGLQAEISLLATNVEQLASRLEQSKAVGDLASTGDTVAKIGSHLTTLQDEARRIEDVSGKPMVLRAPIDGVVTEIYHHTGENLLAGDPILTISGTKSDRLVGYLRQPYWIDLKPGMAVHVRARSGNRLEAESQISGVGAHFEVITNAAFIRSHNGPYELGLPLAVSIPPALKEVLRPGELVDVTVKPK